jgi:hypothetical protein
MNNHCSSDIKTTGTQPPEERPFAAAFAQTAAGPSDYDG